jgi:uncharacterized OB-fold protein
LSDHEVFALFPKIMIDRDNIAHYRGLLEKRLLINRCDACGYWIYPHRPLCPECLSWQVTPTAISGHGHVFMFTLLHQLRDPESVIMEPVCAAAVELVERPGLRYLSRIVGCPLDAITLDMAVTLTWIEERGHPMPAFTPVGA